MTASKKNAEYDRSRMAREYAEIQQKCFSQEETIKALSKIKNEREAEIIALDEKIDSLRLGILNRDESIANFQSQLEDREAAIANLTTENQKLEGYLAEAAKTEIFLSEELQRFKYGIVPGEEPCGEQLQLFPTPEELPPEEQAAVIPELPTRQPEQLSVISNQSPVISEEQPPAVNSEEREVSRGELIEYIRQNFPKAKINPQNITDAINGKSKRMPEFESTYGFKYIGKKVGQHRFKILSQG